MPSQSSTVELDRYTQTLFADIFGGLASTLASYTIHVPFCVSFSETGGRHATVEVNTMTSSSRLNVEFGFVFY